MLALFPDLTSLPAPVVLHVFSGALPSGPYLRCDLTQPAEIQASVYDLPTLLPALAGPWRPRLVIADPPYSAADAARYQTPMIHRGRALRALAAVTDTGASLAWLDGCWPMHRKAEWQTVGRILVQRSTNHRARVLTLFERQ